MLSKRALLSGAAVSALTGSEAFAAFASFGVSGTPPVNPGIVINPNTNSSGGGNLFATYNVANGNGPVGTDGPYWSCVGAWNCNTGSFPATFTGGSATVNFATPNNLGVATALTLGSVAGGTVYSTSTLTTQWPITTSIGTTSFNISPNALTSGTDTTTEVSLIFAPALATPTYGQYNVFITNFASTFPNGTVLSWVLPATPNDFNVYCYPCLNYGNALNDLPVAHPVPALVASTIATMAINVNMTAVGNLATFDIMAECWSGTTPTNALNSSTATNEISFFFHTPSYLATYITGLGNGWSFDTGANHFYIARTTSSPPQICIMPVTASGGSTPLDMISGNVVMPCAPIIQALITHGWLTATDYIVGMEMGVEPQQGAGSLTFNSFSMTWDSGTFSTSIPLGNFVGVYTGAGGSTALNADGTTTGWTTNTGGGWLSIQAWVNFTASDQYTFVIPAYCSTPAAAPANSIMLYIDQLQMQTSIGNTTTNNWFSQFVNNVAPVQNYTWTGPVLAGWHSVMVTFMTNAYYTNVATANTQVHADRLNITGQGVGLPAEPAGSRNPATNPLSSYHFLNMPFGASATWLSLTSPVAETINGRGGNGAYITFNSSQWSSTVWFGSASHPTWTLVGNGDPLQMPTPPGVTFPVRAPAGAYPAMPFPTTGGDGLMVLCDLANPRYRYVGFGATQAGRTFNWYRMSWIDSYNLNHATGQSVIQAAGLITNLDLNSGVIAHRLIGGLAFNGAASGYGVGTQTSEWSGMPWPACESDASWTSEYTNPNGVPYGSVIGIPPGTTMPSGMSAGGQMLFTALKNYGMFLNVSVGTYPGTTIYVESAAANHALFLQMQGDVATITPLLSVMSNPKPLTFVSGVAQGFGGGAPVVALLPGVQQGYPSLGQPPYTVPTSPLGIPVVAFPRSPSNTIGPSTIDIPLGSFVFFFAFAPEDNGSAVNAFTSAADSAGNAYSIIQPAHGTTAWNIALIYCLKTTHDLPVGSTWTTAGTANAAAGMGVYFLLPPLSGTPTLHASNTTNGAAGTSLSLSAAGTATDLAIGFTLLGTFAGGGAPGATATGLINQADRFHIADGQRSGLARFASGGFDRHGDLRAVLGQQYQFCRHLGDLQRRQCHRCDHHADRHPTGAIRLRQCCLTADHGGGGDSYRCCADS